MSKKRSKLIGDKFIIEDYDRLPAFSSFLPGLAGVKGIPMWTFYTNRGQAMNSFGVHNKANAMMEFNSANTGYENAAIRGFRTFIRRDGEYFEPFSGCDKTAHRCMEIEKNVVSIWEESHDLRITVRYIVLPHENIGAVVRDVTVENLGDTTDLELMDGMPQIIVYGITNSQYKEMSNLFKSWADIKNIENNAPVYTMRASSDDSAEVSMIEGGYFYCVVSDGSLQPIVYDKNVVFDYDCSMQLPVTFAENGLEGVKARSQCFANKVPCAFASFHRSLQRNEKLNFTAFAGFVSSIDLLNRKTEVFCRAGYVQEKIDDARNLVNTFTKDAWTNTANPVFDQYVQQCYLDNFLRGGYPFVIGHGKDKKIVHLFSRKHGDPERDYNFFSIAGEYYSQGNGNYRDVCQNRRNDVFFCPEVGDFNVRQFYNLVQMDGYNPLEIRPNTFAIIPEEKQTVQEILRRYLKVTTPVEQVISGSFTPGQITNAIAANSLQVQGDEENLVEELLAHSRQQQEAGFGEGYWSDHWDYNLDLVEDYLRVYPEKKAELLFGEEDYRYYDSVGIVRPRSDTYVLSRGQARQYGAVEHSEQKANRPGFQVNGTNWLKDVHGNDVTANLFGKMLTLAVNKFALLDNQGLGIEMEGGKPGWNDAMNGLPGLFGSSMPETIELKRLVEFMLQALKEQKAAGGSVTVCEELAEFMETILAALHAGLAPFAYWDTVATAREAFREKVKLSVSGKKVSLSFGYLETLLCAFAEKLHTAVQQALELGDGIMPTYFTYEADAFDVVKNPDGTEHIGPYGLPNVKVHSFRRTDLPCFLEGPARLLAAASQEDRQQMRNMCNKIKASDIYDQKLKMYKTSASIKGISMENGRVRAFTPGWLERESVFLHMEYKYFYGMLKAGLYDEFYQAITDALIPYQNPEVYGRSILENSSFLASSANPDPAVHGQGFVGRLSGSTVEMLSMWLGMFLGKGGFKVCKEKVMLQLSPVLPGNMFKQTGEASFTLCGTCRVTYHNPTRKNTYGADGVTVRCMVARMGQKTVKVQGDTFDGEIAQAVREGKVSEIHVWLCEKREVFPYGKAICYSGYRKGQSPKTGVFPACEEILEDLRLLLALGFRYIRMYDPNEYAERVLRVISHNNLPLRCMVGIDPAAEYNNPNCAWAVELSEEQLRQNYSRNDQQLELLIDLANRYPTEIIAVSVGNENRPSWGSDLVPEERLVGWANKLRSHVGQLITYNEGSGEWSQLPKLAEALDFISIHSYPVWNRIPVCNGVAYNKEDLQAVQALYPQKQVIFTECGWATQCNDAMDATQVGEEQQKYYIQQLNTWAEQERICVFLFEAFDESWKGGEAHNEPEKHWGLYREDRTPKLVVKPEGGE